MVPRHSLFLQSTVVLVASLLVIDPVSSQPITSTNASSQVLFSYDRQSASEPASPAGANQLSPVPSPLVDQLSGQPASETVPPTPLSGSPVQFDSNVAQAGYVPVEDENVKADKRRLAPPSKGMIDTAHGGQNTQAGSFPIRCPNVNSLSTAGAGLALVVGLFLLCVSLVRKGKPNSSTPLPSEAVSVLGRIPLTARHFAYLIQIGTKLVLVAVTTDSVQTITEVSEPVEVERLMALCMKTSSRSTSMEFQRMLQQMSKEPARGFLG